MFWFLCLTLLCGLSSALQFDDLDNLIDENRYVDLDIHNLHQRLWKPFAAGDRVGPRRYQNWRGRASKTQALLKLYDDDLKGNTQYADLPSRSHAQVHIIHETNSTVMNQLRERLHLKSLRADTYVTFGLSGMWVKYGYGGNQTTTHGYTRPLLSVIVDDDEWDGPPLVEGILLTDTEHTTDTGVNNGGAPLENGIVFDKGSMISNSFNITLDFSYEYADLRGLDEYIYPFNFSQFGVLSNVLMETVPFVPSLKTYHMSLPKVTKRQVEGVDPIGESSGQDVSIYFPPCVALEENDKLIHKQRCAGFVSDRYPEPHNETEWDIERQKTEAVHDLASAFNEMDAILGTTGEAAIASSVSLWAGTTLAAVLIVFFLSLGVSGSFRDIFKVLFTDRLLKRARKGWSNRKVDVSLSAIGLVELVCNLVPMFLVLVTQIAIDRRKDVAIHDKIVLIEGAQRRSDPVLSIVFTTVVRAEGGENVCVWALVLFLLEFIFDTLMLIYQYKRDKKLIFEKGNGSFGSQETGSLESQQQANGITSHRQQDIAATPEPPLQQESPPTREEHAALAVPHQEGSLTQGGAPPEQEEQQGTRAPPQQDASQPPTTAPSNQGSLSQEGAPSQQQEQSLTHEGQNAPTSSQQGSSSATVLPHQGDAIDNLL